MAIRASERKGNVTSEAIELFDAGRGRVGKDEINVAETAGTLTLVGSAYELEPEYARELIAAGRGPNDPR